MCIRNYQIMLKEIANKVLNNEFKYKSTIVVGDNSSGKSELLKELLLAQNQGFYFIDSVNRSFDFEKANRVQHLLGDYKSVLKRRLSEECFNLKDSFDFDRSALGSIEQIYFNYNNEIEKIIKGFLNIDFKIELKKDDILGEKRVLNIEGGIETLSSGYQAIVRLFLEIIYFDSVSENNIDNPVIVIDEINEFLSTKNEEKILPFLMNKFKKFNFIITTHSADVIASSINCNIIVLSHNNYECLDGNDYETITDVREIFEKIYNFNHLEKSDDIESDLRNLLNLKISNNWTSVEDEKLKDIDETILTNAQRLIVNQIKSW